MVDKTMREVRIHGDSGFPVAIYEWEEADEDGLLLECHWHEQWEFIAIYEGQALLSINGKKRLFESHDVILIPGNSLHMAETYKDSFCRYRSIVFSLSILYGVSNDIVQEKYLMPLSKNQISTDAFLYYDIPLQKEMVHNGYTIFDKLYTSITERSHCYEILTKAYLYELLAHTMSLLDMTKKSLTTQGLFSAPQSIKKSITFMTECFPDQITLPQLALMANMSMGHFGKLFKQMTSYSPMEYLINLRLSKAADELINTNKQVLTIAFEVGFNNIGYFIRSFEKKYGCTPRQYRKVHSDVS